MKSIIILTYTVLFPLIILADNSEYNRDLQIANDYFNEMWVFKNTEQEIIEDLDESDFLFQEVLSVLSFNEDIEKADLIFKRINQKMKNPFFIIINFIKTL